MIKKVINKKLDQDDITDDIDTDDDDDDTEDEDNNNDDEDDEEDKDEEEEDKDEEEDNDEDRDIDIDRDRDDEEDKDDEENKEENNIENYLNDDDDNISTESTDNEEEYSDEYPNLYNIRKELQNVHPEILTIQSDEMLGLARVVRSIDGSIIDILHTTYPFITKYEKTRVIGMRAEQIESGAPLFISTPSNIINSQTIAIMEYEQKKIPFIISRPLPNGANEYWHLRDLEYI